MRKIEIQGKKLDLEREFITKRGIKLKPIDLIQNVEANVQRVIMASMKVGQLPFNGSKKVLKGWLINNQGYDKYVPEVYHYFVSKCRL